MSEADRFSITLDVTLRLCCEDDLAALEWFGAFAHHRQILREAFELQEAGQALMLLALAHGFPIGQAWLDLRLKSGAEAPGVWALRVLDPFRGQGLGQRLIAGLEALARARGLAALEVGVETDNPAARRFFERLGWRLVRRRKDSYGYVTPDGRAVTHALDEWVLAKPLGQAASDSPTRA